MINKGKNGKHLPHQYFGGLGRVAAGFLPVLIFMGLLNASHALAHGVSIFAWVQGDTVHTQSKFMGGKRPSHALVEVFDETGNLLLKGKTDAQGLFSFRVPIISDMQIVLTAGMGHRAVWALSRADLQETTVEPENHQQMSTITPGNSVQSDLKTQKVDDSPENGLSEAELTALVESLLDRKLKPLMDKISALEENRISLPDILGGIGYIVGLVGLAAYMQYRGKRSHVEK
jgi:nickel transport protein